MQTHIVRELFQIEIASSNLVITANQRLALRLQQTYDKGQIDLEKTSWPSPNIVALTNWMQLLADKHLNKTCLSNQQELYLWESIIRATCDDNPLLNPSDTASKAASAWQTLLLWNVDFRHIADDTNQEIALFYQWCLQLDTVLKSKNWITAAEIPNLLLKLDTVFLDHAIQKVILVGFDELPPAINTFFLALEKQYKIISVHIEKAAETILQTTFHDQHAEIQAMATWAAQQHHQHPQAKIGCIVPQLATLRRTLFNVFSETITPEYCLPGTTPHEKQFNISAGQPLHAYPIIRSALDIINWLTQKIDIDLIGSTLQSPYLHQTAQEQDDGARIDSALRDYNEFELHFASLFAASTKANMQTRLIQRLYETHNIIKAAPKWAHLTQWKALFYELLSTAGWPGYRTLNSEEYQLCMRFRQLLDEYTHYALVCEEQISLTEALYLLNKQARNTIFQAEGSHANVQILGTLEAAGNNFDYMWVMGLDDETWPAAPQPNPFIPYILQKDLNMPHATAERELIYTQYMMQRLCHSSRHIIFSASLFEDDKQKSPSRLLHPFTYCAWETRSTPSHNPIKLDNLIDSQAPAINDNEIISGGSWILKQQAACPFKAFATIRLNATTPSQPQFGIAASERGTLIHDVLERIWTTLKNQHQLMQLSTTDLHNLINDTIEKAIDTIQKPTDSELKKQLFKIDKKRIFSLIQEWLNLEKKRGDFTVSALESTQHITLNQLTFSLRIDRIDRLANGNHIIIDYKTGKNSIDAWFGERLSDPQLPLYLCINNQFNGLSYAQVRSNECTFNGVVCSDELTCALPGSKNISSKSAVSWAQQIEIWKSNLEQLAEEFTSGLASVTPNNPSVSCAHCDLQPLCRVEMQSC